MGFRWGGSAALCGIDSVAVVRIRVSRFGRQGIWRLEFVVHIGTVVGFIQKFTGEYKSWLSHHHLGRLIKNNKRLLNDHVQRTAFMPE